MKKSPFNGKMAGKGQGLRKEARDGRGGRDRRGRRDRALTALALQGPPTHDLLPGALLCLLAARLPFPSLVRDPFCPLEEQVQPRLAPGRDTCEGI